MANEVRIQPQIPYSALPHRHSSTSASTACWVWLGTLTSKPGNNRLPGASPTSHLLSWRRSISGMNRSMA